MPENNNDLIKIKFEHDGVKILIDPKVFSDKNKATGIVMAAVNGKKVAQIDEAAIKNAVDSENTELVTIAPAQPEPIDGRVLAEMSDDKTELFLKIEPPMGRGKKAEMKDVMQKIKEVGASAFFLDLEKIEEMLSSVRFRDFVHVGELRNGTFEVNVSKDGTEATIKLSPPFGGMPIETDDILRYLQRNNITTGIKKEVINKLIDEEIFNEKIVIVEGEKAVDGENGEIKFFFDHRESGAKPTVNEEGEVDFKELNLFQKIRAGEPLALRTPATPGVPGKTIFGTQIIPRQGKDVPSPMGLNTKPSPDDPNLIIAALDGQPKLKDNKINIIPVLEIPGDVDYSTGNLNFTGSIHVRGNVISGFTIKAMGDIEIGGCVEMCTIECGGNLSVKQGIVGQDKALVMCRGNITCKFIDKATVYADGDILVDESLMYSKVSSSGNVVLAGKKGFIMGGITRASKTIRCNQTGTSTQTATILEVGGSPTLREEMQKIEQEIREAEANAEKQSKSIESAQKKKQVKGEISDDLEQRVLLMSRERFALMSKLRAFKEKKEDLEEKLVRLRSSGLKVHVKNKVLPGTKICIKNASWLAQDPLDFATFREYDGEVEFGPYEGE
ncbi:MAG TPA: FapA family protein [bacterium]|nr:FapA family protein [bacterium]